VNLMPVYVAFLRGINVGGRNLIRMKDICDKLESVGFQNVSSYRASGNILFESEEKPKCIVERIEEELHSLTGRDIAVFLRDSSEIKEIVESEPFKGRESSTAKSFITLISHKTPFEIALPVKSLHADVEVFLQKDGNVFSQAYPRKGRYGAPNKLVESKFKLSATTRNMNTLTGLLDVLKRDYI